MGWFAGFLGGFIVASGFVDLVGFGPVQAVFAYSILGLFLGSVVGLIQWRVIRRRVAGTFLWVAASAAGMAVAGGAGYGIAVLIFGYSEDLEGLGTFGAVLGWTLVAACGGALTGALQSRAMRRHSPWAGWWVVASTVGWGLSMAVAGTVIVMASRLVGEPDPGVVWFFAAALIAGGATLGLFTGSAIVRLLTQPTT